MKTIGRKEFLFLISAGLTGLIYIGMLFLLRDIWILNPYVSVTVAYVSAMAFYFLSNRLVVFKKKDGPKEKLHQEILHFSILTIVNFLITLFLVWIFMRFTGEVYSGSVAAGIVTTLLAYLVFERIFR